jgi:3-dehydroquinate synthase
MPTTLVGMIDAAHGGKTAANFGGTKNVLGSYHLPAAVHVHPDWLTTLPQEELHSGWFELAKHALLEGPAAWASVAAVDFPSCNDILPRIEASIATKLRIAEADPHEAGPRKALNFGHTVGHALEAWSHAHSAPMTHGRCVGHGMRCALRFGAIEVHEAADAPLRRWLGDGPPAASPEAIWAYMLKDKKNTHDEVREVVLDAVGQPRWDMPLTFDTFAAAWNVLQAPET